MERLTKYVCITEVISVFLFLLCLAGGLFLDQGILLYRVCELVANVCWVTLLCAMLMLLVLLMLYFLRYCAKLMNTTGRDRNGMLLPASDVSSAPKARMPWFWVVLACAWFFVLWMVIMPLMAAGQG